jgi:phosphohistidine phosphatase
MQIYLIRHAEAAPETDTGDAERPLTPVGEAQARKLAATLTRLGVKLKAMVSSPLLRARQTAVILREAGLPIEAETQFCDDLALDGRRKKVVRFLRETGADSIAIVGHQPNLSAFLGWLIGGKNAHIEFDKAGVALVTCDEIGKGSASLIWLMTPELFTES